MSGRLALDDAGAAIVPTFGIVKVSRISARPSIFSVTTAFGRSPAMAAFTSSSISMMIEQVRISIPSESARRRATGSGRTL